MPAFASLSGLLRKLPLIGRLARQSKKSQPAFALAAIFAVLSCCFTHPAGAAAQSSVHLRVALVAPDAGTMERLTSLRTTLAAVPGIEVVLIRAADPSATAAVLTPLRNVDTAVFVRGPGPLGDSDAATLRTFLQGAKGLVVIAATAESWPTEPAFLTDVLGAAANGRFAGGAPMKIINLFPHPIFTGIERFDTNEGIPLFSKLADDAQMIMEGTVGEATAPLAWVRRRAGGRLCHLVPGTAAVLQEPAYQRLITNAVLWSAGRHIPGAQPAVQRTFMPDAYPGAFAITFPNGPGVCFDPVRGGINYIWDGDFVDLRPRWITKQGEPAKVLGETFYREKEWQPLRAGAPDRDSNLEFRGYTIQDGGPEFHYEIGGREVHEKLSATTDGGLLRTFRVGPGTLPLWLNLEPQADAEVAVRGMERDGALATFASKAAGGFTVEIRRKPVTAR